MIYSITKLVSFPFGAHSKIPLKTRILEVCCMGGPLGHLLDRNFYPTSTDLDTPPPSPNDGLASWNSYIFLG